MYLNGELRSEADTCESNTSGRRKAPKKWILLAFHRHFPFLCRVAGGMVKNFNWNNDSNEIVVMRMMIKRRDAQSSHTFATGRFVVYHEK